MLITYYAKKNSKLCQGLLAAQGHQWILLKTWVIGILSAGEGEGGSLIWSESDLA